MGHGWLVLLDSRIGVHHIFSCLLVPMKWTTRNELIGLTTNPDLNMLDTNDDVSQIRFHRMTIRMFPLAPVVSNEYAFGHVPQRSITRHWDAILVFTFVSFCVHSILYCIQLLLQFNVSMYVCMCANIVFTSTNRCSSPVTGNCATVVFNVTHTHTYTHTQ